MRQLKRIGSPEELDALKFGDGFDFPTPWGELAHCFKESVHDGFTFVEVQGTYAPGHPFYDRVCEMFNVAAKGDVDVYTHRDGKLVWRVTVSEHKPCPFCDEDYVIEAKRLDRYEESDGVVIRTGESWAVVCPWCGTRGPSADTEQEAWGLWDSGIHGERDDYAEAYRRVGLDVYRERLVREGILDE